MLPSEENWLSKCEGKTRTSLKLFMWLETTQWFLTWWCPTSGVNVPDYHRWDGRKPFFQSILMAKVVLLQKKKIWGIKKLSHLHVRRPFLFFWWLWLLSCLQLCFYRKWVFSMKIRITVRKGQFPVEWELVDSLCFSLCMYSTSYTWSHSLPLWCHHLCTITNKKLTS